MYTLNGCRLGGSKVWAGAAALVLVAVSLPAVAQKMYRCGSVYQDHACSGNQTGKVLGQSGATLSGPKQPVDAACSARGTRSQKISWAREAGRTQDEQINAAPQDTTLINEVYNLRGSAVDIRTAVEANCMAAKSRATQAAALEDAAAKLRGADTGATVAPTAAPVGAVDSSNAATTAAEDAARRRAESDAVSKKLKCGSIANRIRSIRDSQRAGSSGEAMDRLKLQLQEMEASSREAGC